MIDVFEQALQRDGPAARSRARAIAALCVGGTVLARSIEDRALADELRQAAAGVALSLGRWRAERQVRECTAQSRDRRSLSVRAGSSTAVPPRSRSRRRSLLGDV
jgi:hypothetical protein